ncbi:MAG: 5-carboxymethyl-2-hydroxymuconate isomerase [Flammeovirgaceae bacterium]|nr:5-carboxymethyl-2-hydroxymuconate isomerase [Flammeovirgaceae bacterium]MBE61116.1 5-carboxymethyl-2-hydroxymuconate isomerase [Flammeovirgaceae bacterium]MBR08270.1 5-carboxymethyl-2-hydroxymuconate isomerase [Rickettsiales bacterium]HCX21842.1 5-carboxymethyl-2-hydroxymuconate isomerase [Cytophagales bacterium]|tara:strand:- start:23 stop:379 length:357 start_codon:yes stop_codon:yes gene_type:complete
MPHLIIECSANVVNNTSTQLLMNTVYVAAESTKLFTPGDIKVRIRPFETYQLAEGQHSFLHVFGYIMQGRTDEQKKQLSEVVVSALNQLIPDTTFISMNVMEFEKANYFNKGMIKSNK